MTRDQVPGYEAALANALSWAAAGVPSFPIAISWDQAKSACNKRPLTDHSHKDPITDAHKLKSLFEDATERLQPGEVFAAGLWTGPAGYVILDVDVKGGARGAENLARLEVEHGPLDRTPRVRTASGGEHVWLRKDADDYIGNPDLASGIEVRADAGWIVAPGTATQWGEWQFKEPADDVVAGATVARWPMWLA